MNPTNVTFAPMDMISKSWEIFKNNVGPLLGGLLILTLILLGCAIVPIVGALASMAITGPLILGYYKMARDAVAVGRLSLAICLWHSKRCPRISWLHFSRTWSSPYSPSSASFYA